MILRHLWCCLLESFPKINVTIHPIDFSALLCRLRCARSPKLRGLDRGVVSIGTLQLIPSLCHIEIHIRLTSLHQMHQKAKFFFFCYFDSVEILDIHEEDKE